MSSSARGALIQYGASLLGPIPNIVVFQFNPEQLARTLNLRAAGGGESGGGAGAQASRPRETGQAAGPPTESFTVTAHFSAADDLGRGGAFGAVPRLWGIAPQLAALQMMVTPPGTSGGLLSAAIDAIGDALSGGAAAPTRAVPRVQVPRVLFIWGVFRVLPVRITSLSLTEKQFDFLLNPVQAEAQIGLEVVSTPASSDIIAQGAYTYSATVREAQSAANLVKAAELFVDIIPF